MKKILTIKGTHCNACKVLIEDIASETPGVTSCTVDFKSGKTEIEHDDTFDMKALKKEIEDMSDYKVQEHA